MPTNGNTDVARATLVQTKFYASERCQTARAMLLQLVDSPDYDTSANRRERDFNFCERHLDYLSRNPNLEINGYMSNLRLMTRIRNS